jgi:hypothetical protein
VPLALKHSSWLVVLGSTAFVACSIYTSDLLVQDDTLKPRPSASVTGPTASAARTDAPNPRQLLEAKLGCFRRSDNHGSRRRWAPRPFK